MYQYDAITAAIANPFTAFPGRFRAAQSAGNATKIANVHFVSIPRPQQAPNTRVHFEFEKSFVLRSAHSEIATMAVSQYSSMVSRDSQSISGMKFAIVAASTAVPGSMTDRAIP